MPRDMPPAKTGLLLILREGRLKSIAAEGSHRRFLPGENPGTLQPKGRLLHGISVFEHAKRTGSARSDSAGILPQDMIPAITELFPKVHKKKLKYNEVEESHLRFLP